MPDVREATSKWVDDHRSGAVVTGAQHDSETLAMFEDHNIVRILININGVDYGSFPMAPKDGPPIEQLIDEGVRSIKDLHRKRIEEVSDGPDEIRAR